MCLFKDKYFTVSFKVMHKNFLPLAPWLVNQYELTARKIYVLMRSNDRCSQTRGYSHYLKVIHATLYIIEVAEVA